MNDLLGNIFLVLGGLGLFLFGMKMMSNGLEVVAGDRLQGILTKATSNRFLAAFVGILATIAMNSSTAVTIMVVGFVNSGLLTLVQSIGVILGANIGTTFSAQLIAFRIDSYAPIFIFIGIIMHMFFKKRNIKNIGYIILGFGVLFFGITTMGAPLRELGNHPSFINMLTTFENPLLALLAGFLFTAIVQSSSATMGILVTMYLHGTPMPFTTAAFIILGVNIGTSITTLVASIPANRDSKRAATFHIMFDIIGSIVFGTLIFTFPSILNWFQTTFTDGARQVAMFHTLYNVATFLLILPFVNHISKLMLKIIPQKPEEVKNRYEKKLIYLDKNIGDNASLAVTNAHLELCRMGKIANENLVLALESFFERDSEKAQKVLENEKIINYLNHNITAKLVLINNMNLSNSETEKLGRMFQNVVNIERIGDHAENIAEYTLLFKEKELQFSNIANKELKKMSDLTIKMLELTLESYKTWDETYLLEITQLEEEVDAFAKKLTQNHIKRLMAEKCNPKSGVIFTDMIIDLERCSDHAKEIVCSTTKVKNKKHRNKRA